MCYPADHYDGVFIPNWAMWFVAELKEYAPFPTRRQLGLRKKIEKLIPSLEQYENSDGLLEKLRAGSSSNGQKPTSSCKT